MKLLIIYVQAYELHKHYFPTSFLNNTFFRSDRRSEIGELAHVLLPLEGGLDIAPGLN